MKELKTIILLMVVALLPMSAWANEGGDNKELDIPEIVLEHLADSYEWHIASYQGSHISIPLPIIVRSENTGEWHFCTAHSLPEPFFFSEEHHGKIYERVGGEEVRPLDLSITKSVLQIWIVVAVLIISRAWLKSPKMANPACPIHMATSLLRTMEHNTSTTFTPPKTPIAFITRRERLLCARGCSTQKCTV
jgi:hypothetical protein